MAEMIAFHTYRTEVLELKGEKFTVEFTKRKDQEEYALFATNEVNTKRLRSFYTPDAAANLKHSSGQALEEAVHLILQSD